MDIDLALQKVIQHEGGYVNNAADHGGPTKYGITQKDMPNSNIQDITVADAIGYYKENYVKPLYAQINDQALGEKIVDMGVLFGVKTAVRMLQTSMESEAHLVSDGDFGPETLSDVNQYASLPQYRTTLIQHVINIVHNDPSQNVFSTGWVNRINS